MQTWLQRLTPRSKESSLNLSLLVLMGILALVHYSYIFYYGVDVPRMDEWAFLGKHGFPDTFRLSWFFHKHNEHIIFPTRVQNWIGLLTSNWNIKHQVLFNYPLYLLFVFFFLDLVKRCSKVPTWLVLGFGVFLLSASNRENNLWGFQSQFHYVILFFVLATRFFFYGKDTKDAVLAALFLALTALSFTAGFGMAVALLVTFGAYLLATKSRERSQLIALGLAVLLLGLCIGFWLSQGSRSTTALTLPWEKKFWIYLLHLVARGVGFKQEDMTVSLIASLPLMAALFFSVKQLIKGGSRNDWCWLALVLGFLSALVVLTVGRADFGQPKLTRYAQLSIPLVTLAAVQLWQSISTPWNKRFVFVFWLLCIAASIQWWNFRKQYEPIWRGVVGVIECVHRPLTTEPRICKHAYTEDITKQIQRAKKMKLSFMNVN